VSKTIYLIGSLRNERVPLVAEQLRDMGHKVFDDWYGAGNEADDKWQQYENGRKRKYRDALAGEAAQHIFNFDKRLIEASDAVLLVLPAGKSGHLEFGYARGIGKAAVILLDGEPERFDVMYNFANMVTTDLVEASVYIDGRRAPKTDGLARVIAELQAELHAHKIAYRDAMETIARISYCNAQNGSDAMAMRAIAADFIRPGRKML
jgi:nucleoside 2-deoxyribosyltransferase